MSPGAWLWVSIAAMAAGGLLSALFHSLKDMTRTKLAELADARGDEGATARVTKILEDTGGHSTAVALPRMACHMLVAVGIVFWVDAVRGEAVARPVAIGLAVAGCSLVLWVFALVVPHAVATHAAEPMVYAWSRLIRACYIAQRPLHGVVVFFDEVVRRLAGKNETTEAEAAQAEILSVVDEAHQDGQFDETEKEMIGAVVGFSRTTVEQIMTPRTEVEAMPLTNNLGEITKFIRACRHSRIPVFEESLDRVAGMFYIKDLLRWLAGDGARATGKPFELKAILRPAYFVPETKTIRELLQELIDKKVHVAMVADEYGGTSGLVTLEDIVEEVFGEIQDEYEQAADAEAEVVVHAAERAAVMDARAYIRDANAELKAIDIELPEGEDYDTVGGLVLALMGRIPTVGDRVRAGDAELTVLEAEPTRVLRVRLEAKPEEPPDVVVEPGRVEQGT